MFLNKSVLLATITSVPAGMELIPVETGTESLNPASMEFRYISKNNVVLPLFILLYLYSYYILEVLKFLIKPH